MTNYISEWLSTNPGWMLASKLKAKIDNETEYNNIICESEFGFVTAKGKFYSRLRDIPTFSGIKQVIKPAEEIEVVS